MINFQVFWRLKLKNRVLQSAKRPQNHFSLMIYSQRNFWQWEIYWLWNCFSMDSIECKNLSALLANSTERHQPGTTVYDDIKRRPSSFMQSVLPFLGGLGNALSFVSCQIWNWYHWMKLTLSFINLVSIEMHLVTTWLCFQCHKQFIADEGLRYNEHV